MDAEQPSTPTEPAGGQVPNAGQLEQWAREGEQWVAEAGRYDAMLQSFGAAVLAAASLSPGERVADVGCGNGAMTIDAARRVGSNGRVLGIDISTPAGSWPMRRPTRLPQRSTRSARRSCRTRARTESCWAEQRGS